MSQSEYSAGRPITDLNEREIVYVDTPEVAQAHLTHVQRRVHMLLDNLRRVAPDDQVVEVDNAVCDLEAAYQGLVAARLMATIVAVDEADHEVYVMPSGGAS